MNGLIAKDTFEGMDTDSKLGVLFDLLTGLIKRKKIDKAFLFSGGVLGGFTAIVAKWAVWG